jgi:hypothetical protein
MLPPHRSPSLSRVRHLRRCGVSYIVPCPSPDPSPRSCPAPIRPSSPTCAQDRPPAIPSFAAHHLGRVSDHRVDPAVCTARPPARPPPPRCVTLSCQGASPCVVRRRHGRCSTSPRRAAPCSARRFYRIPAGPVNQQRPVHPTPIFIGFFRTAPAARMTIGPPSPPCQGIFRLFPAVL